MATPRRGAGAVAGVALLLLLSLLLVAEVSAAAEFEGFESEDPTDYISTDADDEEFDDLPSFHSPSPPISLSSAQPSAPSSKPDPVPQNPSASPSQTFDLWDDDEFEGVTPSDPTPASSVQPEPSVSESPAAAQLVLGDSPKPTPPFLRVYAIEIACVSFLICFLINYFTGKKQNEKIALSWAAKFATADSIFDKNFSLLGTGDGKDTPLLLKEGPEVFKFYASGRRYCKGLLATMELRNRHDLISRIVEVVLPKKDTISIEVVMNDEAMDHVVLAMARRKAAKLMLKEEKDLQRFAGLMTAPTGRKWIAEELSVVTESKEVASDLISEAVLDQVFGDKIFEKMGKWFISLHFTDQRPGSSKKVLLFKFVLPDAKHMADMTRLIALVPYYIDLVGRYKVKPHVRTKTEAARAKAADEAYKELQNARQEALQKKKSEKKKQLLEEAEAKMSAGAIRKKEEKERARQLKKSMPKVKMLRS